MTANYVCPRCGAYDSSMCSFRISERTGSVVPSQQNDARNSACRVMHYTDLREQADIVVRDADQGDGMTAVLDRWREPDGQPKVPDHDPHGLDIRIVLDARLCEAHRTHGQACRCPGTECGRIAFRDAGENPWITCVCGERFNSNYSQIGSTPFPEPPNNAPLVVPIEGLRARRTPT